MKRLIGILLPFCVLLTACVNDIDNAGAEDNLISFSAGNIDPLSKTTLTEGLKVYWEKGDQISVSGAAQPFSTDLESTAPEAVFTGQVDPADVYYAAYPPAAVVEWGDELLQMNLPYYQEAVAGTFASGLNLTVASTTDVERNFQFRNIVGYMKFTIGESSGKITSVTVRSNGGEPLSGGILIDCSEEMPEAVADSDAYPYVVLASEEVLQPGDYYIAMLPGTYSKGLELTFDGPDGAAVKNVSKSLTLNAGYINSIGTVSGLDWGEDYYVKVQQSYDDWSGDYLITYTTSSSIKVFNSWTGSDKGASTVDLSSKLEINGIPAEDGDPYKAVFTKLGSYYSIYIEGIGYIGCTSSTNSVARKSSAPSSSEKQYLWDPTYENGISLSPASYTKRRLQWNNSANIFRCYDGGQKELTLYRRTKTNNAKPPIPKPEPEPTPDPDPEPDPEPEPEPDPEIPDPVPGASGKYGWYELPAISYVQSGSYLIDSKDSDLYYAHHHCAGGEKGPGGKTARNYTVCFSAEHHCPVWVAAPRHKMYQSGADRTNAYAKDPSIPSDIQYNNKNTGGGCNKGHMLGSAERISTTATNKQVFYYSNIAPQYSSTFNTGGGGWNTLEDWVDGQVCSDTLYVVIGAYFDQYTDPRGTYASPKKISFGGRSDVSCPTMFYYILMRTKNGNTGKPLSQCTRSEIKSAAFVRSHNTAKGTKVSADEMMSVSDLEKVTGFSYFPNVPQLDKTACNPSDWGL